MRVGTAKDFAAESSTLLAWHEVSVHDSRSADGMF